MAYFIKRLSITPALAPRFCAINDDGSKFFRGRPSAPWAMEDGRRLDETTVPSISDAAFHLARLLSQHKSLPDIFNMSSRIGVSEAMRIAIEALEPSLHQFFPVAIIRRDGSQFPDKCYLLNICQALDSLVLEKSNLSIQYSGGTPFVTLGFDREDYRTLKNRILKTSTFGVRKYIYQTSISQTNSMTCAPSAS